MCISKPGVDYLRLFVDYLKLMFFQRLFGFFKDVLNWPKFTQSNLILYCATGILHDGQIVPVAQNELACSPFTDGRSRILQHVIFESRFLGIDPNYNFLWL